MSQTVLSISPLNPRPECPPAIGHVNGGKEDRLSSRSASPPNPACGSGAHGSPVGGLPPRALTGSRLGCGQGKQPVVSKAGVGPAMVVLSAAAGTAGGSDGAAGRGRLPVATKSARERTRTSTAIRPHGPQPCASASSATRARHGKTPAQRSPAAAVRSSRGVAGKVRFYPTCSATLRSDGHDFHPAPHVAGEKSILSASCTVKYEPSLTGRSAGGLADRCGFA